MKRKFKEGIKTIASYMVAGGVGSLAGYIYSLYAKVSAAANVKVRPELANVSCWEAYLANHLGDWLWYHYEKELTTASVIAGGLVFLTAYKLYRIFSRNL
jgi:hypothetical protein